MKKNAEISISEALLWALGIFFLILIIYAFIDPGGLLGKSFNALFSFGFGLSPEKRNPEFQGSGTEIPKEIGTYLENLQSQINVQETKDNCIVDLGTIPKNDKFRINLYNDKIQIDSVGVEVEGKPAITPAAKTISIQGFKPCEISGIAASNMHSCFVANQQSYCSNIGKTDKTISLEKGSYSNYAMRQGKSLCLIKIYEDRFDFGNCNAPRYDGRDGIDSDCVKFLESRKC